MNLRMLSRGMSTSCRDVEMTSRMVSSTQWTNERCSAIFSVEEATSANKRVCPLSSFVWDERPSARLNTTWTSCSFKWSYAKTSFQGAIKKNTKYPIYSMGPQSCYLLWPRVRENERRDDAERKREREKTKTTDKSEQDELSTNTE